MLPQEIQDEINHHIHDAHKQAACTEALRIVQEHRGWIDDNSIREIAEPQYSELVPANDARAFANGIRAVLNGPYAEAAKQFVPRTWGETAQDTVALFEDLIARRAGRRVPSLPLEPSSTTH